MKREGTRFYVTYIYSPVFWNSFLNTSWGGSISLAMVCSVSSDKLFIFALMIGRMQLGTCS